MDADAIVLSTAGLALVHSTAEYCTPVWCRSAHTRVIDKLINDALRIVTRCLRPTPTDNLFLSCQASNQMSFAAKSRTVLARRAQEPKHFRYKRLLSPLGRQLHQLKSRHPFVPSALELPHDAA